VGDLQFYLNVAVTGLSIGAVYALFGQGITLIYKGTRVPNFAHAAIGTVGAYTFVKFWDGTSLQDPTLRFQVPFTGLTWTPDPPGLPLVAALLVALFVTGMLGVAIERFVMRPLANAPTLNLIIVTIALFTLLTGLGGDVFGQRTEAVPTIFPDGILVIGGVNLTYDALGTLAVTVALAAGLAAFFKYSDLGIAIRATADSREVSRLLGISADQVAGFAWAVGSMLATVAGILIASGAGISPAGLANLIVFGFAASLVGGFTSLIGTLVGGLLIGLSTNLVAAAPWPDGIASDIFAGKAGPTLVTLLLVVGLLVTRPKFIFQGIRLDEDTGVSFARAAGGANPEDELRRNLDRTGQLQLLLRDWRIGRWLVGGLVAVLALGYPLFTSSFRDGVLANGVILSTIALSVVVLTGWTGQISLAPMTFAGIGAFGAAIAQTSWSLPIPLVILAGGLLTIPFSLLLGLPALRLRGFFLALVTLTFAYFGENFLFIQPEILARSNLDRQWFGLDNAPLYYTALGLAVLLFLAMRNLRDTRVARAFYALRDSETTAQAMGIDPVGYKLVAFCVSGFIAGIGGSMLGFFLRDIDGVSFLLFISLGIVLQAVVAGVGVLFGAALVGVLFEIIPQLTATPTTGVNQAPTIVAGFLAILTIIQNPNGIGGSLVRVLRPFDASERVAWASADAGGELAVLDQAPSVLEQFSDEGRGAASGNGRQQPLPAQHTGNGRARTAEHPGDDAWRRAPALSGQEPS
jgi:branched-subunit amino acid ABC-type transport system permease component